MKEVNDLYYLKKLGHALLDKYVKLDGKRDLKGARQHAYDKLSTKLNGIYPHFSMIDNEKDCMIAIHALKKMIKQREHKNEYIKQVRLKHVVAPNVMKLQKEISEKNKYALNK